MIRAHLGQLFGGGDHARWHFPEEVATRSGDIITSAALVILFVLVTSPLSTHAIAQAARRRPRRPPPR